MDSIPAGGQSFAIVGIVGGIGSGKSTLARWLCERIPMRPVFADELGHQVLRYPAVKEKLREQFGEGIINPTGEIDRQQLGNRIWEKSEEAVIARQQLEAIVHPEIRQLIQKQIQEAREQGFWGVMLDAAVMMESGLSTVCDRIIFVETDDEVRKQRILQRGWTVENWQEREKSQLSLEEKKRRCHYTVNNTGSVTEAGRQLLEYLEQEFNWPKQV